jgi:hypothetical protein
VRPRWLPTAAQPGHNSRSISFPKFPSLRHYIRQPRMGLNSDNRLP